MQPSLDEIRTLLLKAGVKNLKTFGYPDVNQENILTDMIYREFFRSMLTDEENKPRGPHAALIQQVQTELLEKIDAQKAKDVEQEKAKPAKTAKRAKSKKK